MRALPILLVTLLLATEAAAQGLYGASGARSFTWPNGDNFTGEFRNGLPNGPGTMRYANGQEQSGHWVDGCMRVGNQRFAVFTRLASCPRGAPVPLPQVADR